VLLPKLTNYHPDIGSEAFPCTKTDLQRHRARFPQNGVHYRSNLPIPLIPTTKSGGRRSVIPVEADRPSERSDAVFG